MFRIWAGEIRYRTGSFAASKSANSLPSLLQTRALHWKRQRVRSRSSRSSFPMMMTMMDGKIWQGSTATRAAGRPLWKCCLWRWRHEIDLPPTRRRRRRLCRSLHPTTNSQCLNGNVIISMQSSDLSRAMRYFPNQCLSEHLRLSILTFLQ